MKSAGGTKESSLDILFFNSSHFTQKPFNNMVIPFLVQSLALISAIACNGLSNDGKDSTTYDPGELLTKIFNLESRGRSRNAYRLENQNHIDHGNIYVSKDPEARPIYSSPVDVNTGYAKRYYDRNYGQTYIGEDQRRRKPRVQKLQGFGPEYPGGLPQSGPTEPAKPSLALEALSTVTEALTSLALYDDLQCVPRLLCEAASGGVLGSSQTLQSIAGLQPLLTLLSAYNGISSNPLFVFGRAAFLGMSSKNNPASCRYAYPQCPTDPEKLVYYLNNHNGGFFRFFNAPQRGQSVSQFYDELSQNYPNPQNPISNNNLYQQSMNQDNSIQNYGVRYPYKEDKYGLLNNVRFKNNDEFDVKNRIEKRIQNNRPGKYLDSDEDLSYDDASYHNGKWSFPEADDVVKDSHRVNKGLKFPDYINHNTEVDLENADTYRVGKRLKFPEYVHNQNKIEHGKRDPRGFVFPDKSKRYLDFVKYQAVILSPVTKDRDYFNANVYPHQDLEPGKDQSIRTVYVVRGNGDPRYPEVINLRPGQSVH